MVGQGLASANLGGSVPHIGLFNAEGERMGQYKGDENGHWATGNHPLVIDNNQSEQLGQPEYVTVTMQENDAICISAIVVSGGGATWSWTGDMAFACGAQFYLSESSFGSTNSAPRCAWIDGKSDKGNGIIANGISLHIKDFVSDEDIMNQWNENDARLCQNSARMTFQHNAIADLVPKFFKPPLKYTRQSDPGAKSGGALVEPDRGIDRKRRAYADNAPKLPMRKRHTRRMDSGNSTIEYKNNRIGHLVVSEQDHSAVELCGHPASLGPDFVSLTEKIFCDMETGKTWALCDGEVTHTCFDLEKKEMRGLPPSRSSNARRALASVPYKRYVTSDLWKRNKDES